MLKIDVTRKLFGNHIWNLALPNAFFVVGIGEHHTINCGIWYEK